MTHSFGTPFYVYINKMIVWVYLHASYWIGPTTLEQNDVEVRNMWVCQLNDLFDDSIEVIVVVCIQ